MVKSVFKGIALIACIGILIINVIFAFSYFHMAEESITRDLTNAAYELRFILDNVAVSPQDVFNLLKDNTLEGFGEDLRLSVITQDGQMIFDSKAGAQASQEVEREEFKAVFAGNDLAIVERYDQSHAPIQNVALAIPRYKAALRLSAPVNPDRSLVYYFAGLSLALLVIALFLTRYYLGKRFKRYQLGVELLGKGFAELGRGQYDCRIPEMTSSPYKGLRNLTSQFNVTARVLEDKDELDQQRMARLAAILNTIIDPLFMVDTEKNLLYVNYQAMQVFGRNVDPENHPYPQVLLTHSNELDWLIDEALSSDTDIDTMVLVPTVKGEVLLKALISPIIYYDKVQGVVVALHDLTAEEEALAFRRDFVSNVTHELKTPLTSLRGFIETMHDSKDLGQEQAQHFLNIMDVEALRLESLIDDILSLSEVERGKVKEITSFDLNELIDEVIVLLDDQASTKKIAVFTAVDNPECLTVRAERDRIKQVLINLVDNAIKYNENQGKVSISAQRLSDQVVQIIVEDNGPGIDLEAQARIFERFYRKDAGRSRNKGGTGLGLSIVKHIAKLYKGEARVVSEPGKGSKFIVTMAI